MINAREAAGKQVVNVVGEGDVKAHRGARVESVLAYGVARAVEARASCYEEKHGA